MKWVGSLIGSVLKWLVELVVRFVIELVIELTAWMLGRIWILLSRAWRQVFGGPTGGDLP